MQRSTISYRHLSRNQLSVTYLLVATSALPCEIKKKTFVLDCILKEVK